MKITAGTLWRRCGPNEPVNRARHTPAGRGTTMMGPAHSLSGAAAWLGVGAATAAAGHPMPWPVLIVGALICAGAALAPDLDHKSATISRAFGPLSKGLCEVVDKISYAVYKAPARPRTPAAPAATAPSPTPGSGRSSSGPAPPRWPSRRTAGASSRCCSSTWSSRSRASCGGRPGCPATSWSGCSARPAPGSWRACSTSPATGRTGCSPAPARSTSGWVCPSCSARWSTTSETPHRLGLSGAVAPADRREALVPDRPPKAMRFRAGSWVELKVLMPVFVLLGGFGGASALGFI